MRHPVKLEGAPLRFTLTIALLVTLSAYFFGCASSYSRQRVGVSVEYASDDYAVLAGYGEWVNLGFYGMVWHPYVISSWQPFYYGHWVWAGSNWAWVSYEPYGWLVYHYGYWDYDPGIGWFWIPDNVWSPAQVQWVVYADYVCWTPLPPPGIKRPRIWESRVTTYWNVVKAQDFTREDVGRYRMTSGFNERPDAGKSISTRSPKVSFVQKYSGDRVQTVKVQRQKIQMQDHQFQKMVLPANEVRKVDRHQSRVEREVLQPQKASSGKMKGQEKKDQQNRSKGKKPDS